MSTNELTRRTEAAIEQLPEKHRRRGVATGAGATIGAVIGSALGGPGGAAVGAAVGGALGVGIGERSQSRVGQ